MRYFGELSKPVLDIICKTRLLSGFVIDDATLPFAFCNIASMVGDAEMYMPLFLEFQIYIANQ